LEPLHTGIWGDCDTFIIEGKVTVNADCCSAM